MRKVLLLLFCFSLISCKNFLDGSSIKKELDGVIAYEKAFKTSVRIMVDTSDYGDIYPPEAALIKGDALEITFTKKKDAVFKKWVCYSSDLSQIIEDAVTFTEESEQSFDSGLTQYKVKAVLNKDDLSDIVIKPKCYLSTETEAPVINKLFIARTEDDAINGTNFITLSDYENDAIDYAWIKNHHVAQSVWVYFEGTDSSGCDSLTVTERLTFDTEGNEVSGAAEISKQIQGIEFTETGCSACFEYVFDQVSDGIIELIFELTDAAGNSNSLETSLVKDSIVKPKSDLSNEVDKQKSGKETEKSRTVAEVLASENLTEDDELPFPWYFVFKGDPAPYATDINGDSYYDRDEWTIEKIECWTDEDSSKQQLDFEYTKENDNEGTLTTSSIDFLRKAYEDLYILITLKDSVGNIHEHKMDLYKSLEIRQCVKNSTALVLVLNKSINERASPQVLVSYKLAGEEEFTSPVKSNVVNFDKSAGTATVTGVKIGSKTYEISELPEGEYKFSVQGAGKTYISSPWLYQTSASQGQSDVLSADDVPEISVTAEKAVLNAGKRRVKVHYQEGFIKNKDFTYVIQYSPDSTFASGFAYSSQDEFDIQNASSVYYFRMLVYDQEGNYLASDKAQLDLSYDNIPPQINSDEYGWIKFPEKVVFDNLAVSDSTGSGVKKDSENKVIIQYFFSNKDLTINSSAIDWTSATMAINILYWDETENLTVYKDSNTQKNLYLCFSDNNSNYTEVKIELGTQSGESPQIDYNKDTGLLTVDSRAYAQYLKNTDGTHYEWAFINDRNGIGFTSYTLTDEEKESFVRVWTYTIDYDTSDYYISNYFYFYPSLASENYKLADLSAGSRGITVFTDQPCLVQTFYCTYDLGQDASEWINRGIESQRQTEKTSFTYVIDKDSIPYTNYYTTVVQFADGTVVMSDVKQNY